MSKRKGEQAHTFLANLNKKSKPEEKASEPEKVAFIPEHPTFLNELETPENFVNKEEQFEKTLRNATDADLIWEFDTFLKRMPTNIPNKMEPSLSTVKKHLDIDAVMTRAQSIKTPLEKKKFSNKTMETPVLDSLAIKLGKSLRYIAPPINHCLYCKRALNLANDPTQVQLHTRLGTYIATRYSLRCQLCPEARKHGGEQFCNPQDIFYHPTRFGNKKFGIKFYPDDFKVDLVRASYFSYVEALLAKQSFAEMHHGWLSSQAKTEAFNETYRGTYQNDQNLKFLSLNPHVGKQFLQQKKECDEGDEPDDDDENEESDENHKVPRMHELKTKQLCKAVEEHEIIAELKENKEFLSTNLGPIKYGNKTRSYKETKNGFFRRINEQRKSKLYEHNNCHEGCQKRGCDKITGFDGDWKIQFPHCMWDNSTDYPTEITDFVPQVCPEQPEFRSAFCLPHGKAAKSLQRPVKLRDFIKSCGSDPEKYSKEGKGNVQKVLKTMAHKIKVEQQTVAEEQGTQELMKNKRLVTAKNVKMDIEEEKNPCREKLGECIRLQGYSRGVFAACSGGGHIWSFDILYKSEGPTQVALLMLKYLQKKLKDVPQVEWHNYIICYDNMCNVCKLRLLQNDLPLPNPFQTVWKDVVKVIDGLHIKNHSKNKDCATLYNPDQIRETFPHANLMVCEQTFSWLSKFKKILNSMPKYKQLFMLHRLCKWRNLYTEYCYSQGMKPVLPALKIK